MPIEPPNDRCDTAILIAKGRIGIVDAALVRWLTRQRAEVNHLVACVTQSIFEPLLTKGHLEEFLAALQAVDEVLKEGERLPEIVYRHRIAPENVKICLWPETELLNYSVTRVCKRLTLFEEKATASKLTTLDKLRKRYGPTPRQRRKIVGLVSGSFDLIHPGHICLIQAAKQRVDVLVVLAMSTASIQRQEKNQLGDRPIYNERERTEVLSALRSVDHLVMFDGCDCQHGLRTFCPNYFIKSADDRSRPVVQAEAARVKSLGGETIYLPCQHPGYSSTAIIRHIRYREASSRQILIGRAKVGD